MSYDLIIRLQKNATEEEGRYEWVLMDKSHKQTIQTGEGLPDESDALFKEVHEIIVIVPMVEIFLTEVIMPRLSPDRLKKAIPYALEDKLTEDASSLNFIIGQEEKPRVIPVAVVNQERMLAWQTILNNKFPNFHSHINVLIPEALVLPWHPHECHILLDKDIAVVRVGKQAGFAIEKDLLFESLKHLFNTQKPTAITLYTTQEQESMTAVLAPLDVPVHTNRIANPLAMMAENIKKPYPFNLIENVYSLKQRRANVEMALSVCAAIAGVWLLVSTGTNIANYFILNTEEKSLSQQQRKLYSSLYPKISLPKDAQYVLKKELKQLQTGSAENAFLRLTNMVSPEMVNLTKSGLTITKMTYKNRQIEFDVSFKNPALLEDLVKSLQSKGIKVVLSNTSLGTEGLIGAHLTINEVYSER